VREAEFSGQPARFCPLREPRLPLTPEDVAKNNFVQFPIINGAVVPILNLPGIKLGEITLEKRSREPTVSRSSDLSSTGKATGAAFPFFAPGIDDGRGLRQEAICATSGRLDSGLGSIGPR